MAATAAEVLNGDALWAIEHSEVQAALRLLPSECVQTCCTSPPYFGLRDYGTGRWEGGEPECSHKQTNSRPDHSGGVMLGTRGERGKTSHKTTPFRGSCGKCGAQRVDDQIGLEDTPEAFVTRLVDVFREVYRVLHPTGSLWLNIGDGYNAYNGNRGPSASFSAAAEPATPSLPGGHGLTVKGLKPKDLIGIPWMLAFALRADGWYLRAAITWAKVAPMPESVRDRPTRATEMLFLLTKGPKYYYDQDAERVPLSGNLVSSARRERTDNGSVETAAIQGTGFGQSGKGSNAAVRDSEGRNLWDWWEVPDDSHDDVFWKIVPEPQSHAHYAAFPTEIPRRCIRLGSSSHGQCPHCFVPWRRVTERAAKKRKRPNDLTKRDGSEGTGNHCANTVAGVSVQTLSWAPSCKCCAVGEPVPQIVLDPFCGSATTGVVARRLGRRFIGLELAGPEAKVDYVALGRRRIAEDAPLMDAAQRAASRTVAGLFDGLEGR